MFVHRGADHLRVGGDRPSSSSISTATFGFDDVRIKFADRPAKRVGADDIWDRAEAALKAASAAAGIEYTLNRGEGAFYGPKLEFVLT